jgi:diguanylate cyclase (GGDEF)-like protein/putative nucleotidyltransferase with HDIG domain
MNSYTAVQLLSLIIYVLLIIGVLFYTRTRLKKFFLIFLFASAAWSLVSYFTNASTNSWEVIFYGKLVPLFASWSVVAYAHFIALYTRNRPNIVMAAGYFYLLIVGVLIILGYLPQQFIPLENGPLHKDYGHWLYILTAGGAMFMGTSIFLLIKTYRSSRDPEQKNRLSYLLAGISLLVVFGSVFEALPTQKFAVDHIGHLGNSLLIAYTIFKYRLLDMKLVIKKGLVYTSITVFITALFTAILYGLNYVLETTWSTTLNLMVPIGMLVLMAFFFNRLRVAFEKIADKLFYGNRYDYRKMVLSFASRMSNILDLKQLAESMLRPIVNAVSASQVSLLFVNNEYYTTQYAERFSSKDPVIPIRLRRDGPVITWLEREDKPLFREHIDEATEFKALWQEERDTLEAAQVKLLCPIVSRGRLIAILALSKKQPRGYYSRDDTDMLMTMAHEAAVVVENAQLYAKAKQRANTDELTGLFNHRFFHERLGEEIARCSRFGKIFSLVFMDMDLFKHYNDAYGHLQGDKVLEKIGTIINQSVRAIDISCRYGGDEFAILMPESSLESAAKVAERIRKGIESQTDLMGMPLTCSIGIASWPTDGVMKDEIVQSADAALYFAKHTGSNRVCWACEVVLSDVLRMEAAQNMENNVAILNTIYALAATVDAKDHYTYGHSKKVSKYATDIAEALGYSREEIETIRAAALLHDIGKIGIPDKILSKREPLTADDWELIRAHPSLGVSILKHVDKLNGCLAAIQYHHERFDGSGYPSGLKGSNIPLDARILAVADAYDAMTSQRPYRAVEMTREQAFEELRRYAGIQFDPRIVGTLIEISQPGYEPGRKTIKKSNIDRSAASR